MTDVKEGASLIILRMSGLQRGKRDCHERMGQFVVWEGAGVLAQSSICSVN